MVYRYRLIPGRGMEYVSGAVEAITGRSPADFYADPELIVSAVHPDDRPLLIMSPSASGSLWDRPVTLRWMHPDGRTVWAEHQRVPVRGKGGRIVAVEGIVRDVTHRIEAQEQLEVSQAQLRQLAANLQTAREEERAGLARELHDELGQTLTALKLELGRTIRILGQAPVQPEVMNRVQALVGLVEIGVAMVKQISTRLRPPELDHLGLAEAIHNEAAAFKARSGVRCQLRADTDGEELTPTQRLALFRIFQEALTNVARHAHASAVRVHLARSRGRVELRVSDNGRGITAGEASDRRSIGLVGMRERAVQAGATLVISGKRGRGTLVCVQVPLTPAPRQTGVRRRLSRTAR
jgi:PAS domain S-box-containing protein